MEPLKESAEPQVALETERLTVAPATDADLPALLEVFRSNPAYVAATQGPGGHGLGELQRDWHVAALTGRTVLALRRRTDRTVVGAAEVLAAHPDDGAPWLGLLLIQGDLKGQGYGSEAVAGLLHHFRHVLRWPRVRAGVGQDAPRVRRFWERAGFVPLDTVPARRSGGETAIVCLERTLDGGPPAP